MGAVFLVRRSCSICAAAPLIPSILLPRGRVGRSGRCGLNRLSPQDVLKEDVFNEVPFWAPNPFDGSQIMMPRSHPQGDNNGVFWKSQTVDFEPEQSSTRESLSDLSQMPAHPTQYQHPVRIPPQPESESFFCKKAEVARAPGPQGDLRSHARKPLGLKKSGWWFLTPVVSKCV